jgi:hypothetical protein
MRRRLERDLLVNCDRLDRRRLDRERCAIVDIDDRTPSLVSFDLFEGKEVIMRHRENGDRGRSITATSPGAGIGQAGSAELVQHENASRAFGRGHVAGINRAIDLTQLRLNILLSIELDPSP